MSPKKTNATTKRRPASREHDMKFVELRREFAKWIPAPVNKRATVFHRAADDGGEGDGTIDRGSLRPTDEQLDRINQFTRTPKTADEVVAFSTASCNDIVDRDDDQFTTRSIDKFKNLEGDRSFVGKAYMVSHDYTKLPVGRIFGVGTKTIEFQDEKHKSLTNEVYIPNTDANKSFIDNIDFGIYWAVSVGVVMNTSMCSVGEEHQWGPWPWWCSEGHDKGLYYDPSSDEEDSWGYPLPVDPKSKNAVKCIRQLDDPVDAYELSQCFLGAQFAAQLDKDPRFKGVIKAASKSIPVIGLRDREFKALPFPGTPAPILEARSDGYEPEIIDGIYRWTDKKGLTWVFDPMEDTAALLLGKSQDEEDDEDEGDHSDEESDTSSEQGDDGEDLDSEQADDEDDEEADLDEDKHVSRNDEDDGSQAGGGSEDRSADEHERGQRLTARVKALRRRVVIAQAESETADDDEDATALAESLDAVLDEASEAIDNAEYDQADDLINAAEVVVDRLIEVLGGEDADDADSISAMSKKVVLRLCRKAKLPMGLIERVADDDTDDAVAVALRAAGDLVASQAAQIAELSPKAKLGDEYVEEIEADALRFYRLAHMDKANPKAAVNVERAKKMLVTAGGDVETIKAFRDEWKERAQDKFPSQARRSTAPEDPNNKEEPVEPPMDAETAKQIRRLHS